MATDFGDSKFDMKILSSSHINFLFGSGVNGKAFPQFNGFAKTLNKLKEFGCKKINLEEAINELEDESQKSKIHSIFIDELKEKNREIQYDSISIQNIKSLFQIINHVIEDSENRTNSMKQVNVYTLNYDQIIETSLNQMGLLVNKISSSNLDQFEKLFNIVAYDYSIKKYLPTYLISKIHGDLDNPILPGINKYDDVLQAKRFELLFKMKEHLSRPCSLLFVIGYSGHDKHINSILADCLKSGLTLYWVMFSEKDSLPGSLINEPVFFLKGDGEKDSTSLLAERICQSWVQ